MTRKIFLPVLSGLCASALLIFGGTTFPPFASQHYTPEQLEAFASRVGKTYWVAPANKRTPLFLSTPAADAATFRAQANDSFLITELIGRAIKDPFYKVKLASGKEGFMRPETFLEEFNLTILTVDPRAREKQKAMQAADEEKKRLEWIQNRPWPQSVKEAAIRRQVVPGLNTQEVIQVLGKPDRIVRVRGQRMAEEHWHYADGSRLIFHRQLLSRIEPNRNPQR